MWARVSTAGKWTELARQVEKEQAILRSADSRGQEGLSGRADQIQKWGCAPPRGRRSWDYMGRISTGPSVPALVDVTAIWWAADVANTLDT